MDELQSINPDFDKLKNLSEAALNQLVHFVTHYKNQALL